MAHERRQDKRRYVLQGGRIVDADGAPLENCWILDISAAGACLQVKSGDTPPEQFTLLLSYDDRLRRECLVKWRSTTTIGVQFLPRPAEQRA